MSRMFRFLALGVCLCLLLAVSAAARFAMGYLYDAAAVDATRGSLQEAALHALSLTEGGALAVDDSLSAEAVAALHARGLRVVPLLSNSWDRARAEAAVARPEALAKELSQAVADYDLDGVHIDLENLTPEHRAAHTELVRQVRLALPAEKTVAVAVPANPKGLSVGWHGSYDCAALGEIADYLMLMAYDEHYRGSLPGPVASRDFVEAAIQSALRDVPAEKLVLGIPLYGRIWRVDGDNLTGQGLGDGQILSLIARHGGQVRRDGSGAACAVLEVTGGGDTVAGIPVTPGRYQVWYADEEAKKELLALAWQYDLRGAGVWRLGQEDGAFWDYFSLWLHGLPFEDLQGHWAVPSVIAAAEAGWMRGVSSTAFAPDRALTRAEAAALLRRVLALPAAEHAPFSDVKGHWAEGEIAAAAQAGLVQGVGDGRFAPDAPVTREQLAALLYRAEGASNTAPSARGFADEDAVSPYARDAMDWAVSQGLFQGDGGYLRPQASATRAQAAAILVRWRGEEASK